MENLIELPTDYDHLFVGIPLSNGLSFHDFRVRLTYLLRLRERFDPMPYSWGVMPIEMAELYCRFFDGECIVFDGANSPDGRDMMALKAQSMTMTDYHSTLYVSQGLFELKSARNYEADFDQMCRHVLDNIRTNHPWAIFFPDSTTEEMWQAERQRVSELVFDGIL